MTTSSTPAPETESLWASIARLAGILSSEHFPTGDRAALKRMAPDQPPPLAFYRFAFRELPEGWEYRRPVWQTLIARFLAAKAEAVDWTDAARLLLTYSDDGKEQIRREIAGDFYRNLKDKKD